MPEPLVLIGSSVRAAAQSAARAGFQPYGADLFADRDLQAMANCRRVRRYPDELLSACDKLPDAPFLYTGALENYPELVDALALRRPLWGNCGDVLRAVRDPVRVAEALRSDGLSVPEVTLDADNVPRDGTWLRKPLCSGGGRQIAVWNDAVAMPSDSRVEPCYFQQRIEGEPCAALFVAAGGRSVLLGVTHQLVGQPWTGAAPFHYAGSIGPLVLAPRETAAFEAFGARLVQQFGLAGLFGIDAIRASGTVWPIEVNPRYVASVEVLERSTGLLAVECHAAACRDGRLPRSELLTSTGCSGKAIVFARRDVVVPKPMVERAEAENPAAAWPLWADIPDSGTVVQAGRPVLTVLADAHTASDVEERLKTRAQAAEAMLSIPYRTTAERHSP